MHPISRPLGWRRPIFALVLSAFVLCSPGTSAAAQPKVLWVEMEAAPQNFVAEDFMDALRLRLPDWKVQAVADGEGKVPCSDESASAYVVRVVSDGIDEAAILVISCVSDEEILSETLPKELAQEDRYRRGAVLTGMALDMVGGKEPVRAEQSSNGLGLSIGGESQKSRPVATLGGAPTLTVIPANSKALFSGVFEGGVQLPGGLWPRFGAKLSTRVRGETPKGDRAELLDRSFWLGVGYRFNIDRRWFIVPGLFFNYIHSKFEYIGEGSFKVSEESLLGRFGLRMTALAGYQLGSVVALFIEVAPSVSFAERQYEIRGREAFSMGLVNLDFALGVWGYF